MFIAIGILVGFISGFFGVGGGMILVPLLVYSGMGIKYAIGISVVQMAFSSVFGSFLNFKNEKLATLKIPIIIGIGGFIGASFTKNILTYFSSNNLTYLFLIIILLSIFKSFLTPSIHNKQTIESKPILFLLGLFTGVVAISVGVGGAVIVRPVLVGFLNFPIKQTIKISLMFVVFSSIGGVISLFSTEYINLNTALSVASASLIGVFLGTKLVNKVNNKALKKHLIILDITAFCLIILKLIF
jgi:uncharacterized membrane protein YfcA